eukprot:gnl/MRDRNA2_/MRDRNA2_30174_c0_seq1.p1 gnl/MRDRNA2_/MRDRNA2_30174_c0~~gnl/MRDRNA2_/MRDRNA2_30174_c0_seq1.p1  ORF type:complete len:446 (-),score=123.92 gnl/MRDRNA2_/MRDRNA2_30174_c0_seq1:257-1594(-)
MTPPAPAGALVATVGDLSAAVTSITEKIEEQKRWTQSELVLVHQKIKDRAEFVDSTLKSLSGNVDALLADVAELKKIKVNITDFKQSLANVELRAETEKAALEGLVKKTREDMSRDMNTAIQTVTNKCEALDSSLTNVKETVTKMDSEQLPEIRKALEDERTKRRTEDLRLERENEALRGAFDRRVDEVITLLRKDIDTASKKLQEEMATKDDRDKLQRDIDMLKQSLGHGVSALEDAIAALKEALNKHRDSTTTSLEKITKDITQLMKDLSTCESSLKAFTVNCNADFKKIRDSLKEQVLTLQRDLSDARAAAAQACVQNEKQIQVCVSESTVLKEARNLLFDKLKIKEVVTVVRDWQGNHVPNTTVNLGDLEQRVARLRSDLQKEHDAVEELQKNQTQVRSHFKRFHDIASGLDSGPLGTIADSQTSDTIVMKPSKLPPITPR